MSAIVSMYIWNSHDSNGTLTLVNGIQVHCVFIEEPKCLTNQTKNNSH